MHEEVERLQEELDRKDKAILEMRMALIETRMARLDDHETRLRLVEQRTIETKTIVTLAFGTGLLSLGNLVTQWLR